MKIEICCKWSSILNIEEAKNICLDPIDIDLYNAKELTRTFINTKVLAFLERKFSFQTVRMEVK